MILQEELMPFEEKEKVAGSILAKYLNLKTADGRLNCTLCIVSILYIFATQNVTSYYLVLKSLISSIKAGTISKSVGRVIAMKLKKRGIPVDPELIELINS